MSKEIEQEKSKLSKEAQKVKEIKLQKEELFQTHIERQSIERQIKEAKSSLKSIKQEYHKIKKTKSQKRSSD